MEGISAQVEDELRPSLGHLELEKCIQVANPKKTLIKDSVTFCLILSLFYVRFYRKKETKRDKKETKNEGGREDLGAKKLVLEIFLKFFF